MSKKILLLSSLFGFGFLLGFYLAPEERIVEKVVEVEKIEKVPATNQEIHEYCVGQAIITLYSTWNGTPKDGTTPENTIEFIEKCLTNLK